MSDTNAITVARDNVVEVEEYTASNYCSITLDSSENAKLIANAVNAADSLADMGDEVLNVIGVICRPGIRKARSKSQVDAPCTDTILICSDGCAYFTKSEGIRRAVDNFVALGIFTGEPVAMKVEEVDLGDGIAMKTLVLV